jgi:hypothetical protein
MIFAIGFLIVVLFCAACYGFSFLHEEKPVVINLKAEEEYELQPIKLEE